MTFDDEDEFDIDTLLPGMNGCGAASAAPVDAFCFCSHLDRVEWSTGHCDASEEGGDEGEAIGDVSLGAPVIEDAGTLEGPNSQVKLILSLWRRCKRCSRQNGRFEEKVATS